MVIFHCYVSSPEGSWKTVRSVRWIIEICRTTWTKEAPPQPCPAPEHHELPFVVSRPSWAKMSSWKRSWRPCLSSSKRSLGSQCYSSCRVYSLTNKAGHIVGSHRQKGPYGGTTWGGEASGVEKRVLDVTLMTRKRQLDLISICAAWVWGQKHTRNWLFSFFVQRKWWIPTRSGLKMKKVVNRPLVKCQLFVGCVGFVWVCLEMHRVCLKIVHKFWWLRISVSFLFPFFPVAIDCIKLWGTKPSSLTSSYIYPLWISGLLQSCALRKQAQLSEVLSNAKLDPSIVANVTKKCAQQRAEQPVDFQHPPTRNGFGPENVGLIFPMIASHFS